MATPMSARSIPACSSASMAAVAVSRLSNAAGTSGTLASLVVIETDSPCHQHWESSRRVAQRRGERTRARLVWQVTGAHAEHPSSAQQSAPSELVDNAVRLFRPALAERD